MSVKSLSSDISVSGAETGILSREIAELFLTSIGRPVAKEA